MGLWPRVILVNPLRIIPVTWDYRSEPVAAKRVRWTDPAACFLELSTHRNDFFNQFTGN